MFIFITIGWIVLTNCMLDVMNAFFWPADTIILVKVTRKMLLFGPRDTIIGPIRVTQSLSKWNMIVCWDCSLPFNVMGSFGPVCLLCAFTDCIYKTLFVLLPLQFEMWVQLKAVIIRNNILKSFHGSYLGYSYVVKMDKV